MDTSSEKIAERPSDSAIDGVEEDTLVEEISIDGMCGVY